LLFYSKKALRQKFIVYFFLAIITLVDFIKTFIILVFIGSIVAKVGIIIYESEGGLTFQKLRYLKKLILLYPKHYFHIWVIVDINARHYICVWNIGKVNFIWWFNYQFGERRNTTNKIFKKNENYNRTFLFQGENNLPFLD